MQLEENSREEVKTESFYIEYKLRGYKGCRATCVQSKLTSEHLEQANQNGQQCFRCEGLIEREEPHGLCNTINSSSVFQAVT